MVKQFALAGLTLVAGLTATSALAQTAAKSTQTTSTQPTYQANGSNLVTTAVPFLRISPDARAGAMGDVGIAMSPDANAQYWNVAKIPFCEKNYGISATYTPWLKDLVPDIFLAYIAAYAKFGEENNQAISGSMRYFSLGNINYTDQQGMSTGTGQPREFSFDLGYSRKLSEFLSTGLSLRYIHSAIAAGAVYTSSGGSGDYHPASAVSADLGIYYSKKKDIDELKSRTFSFGAVITNLGSKISYNSTRKDFIPMNLGLGVAYTSQFDPYNKITFGLDINKLLVPANITGDSAVSLITGITNSFSGGDQLQKLDISLGAEYWYQDQFAVRAGYFYEDKNNGDRQYITCGLGVRYNVFAINASYLVQGSGITRNPLSNTFRFSLMYEFDKIEKSGGDAPPADASPVPSSDGK